MATLCNFLLFPKLENHSSIRFLSHNQSRGSVAVSSTSNRFSSSASSIKWDQPTFDNSNNSMHSFENPAVGNANVLFFKSGYNVQLVVGEDESEEALLRRFRREVSKAGVIQETKRRRFFENKQEEKKRKTREAARRNRRRRSGPRFPSSTEAETVQKKSEDSEDNWDMPEVNLPY